MLRRVKNQRRSRVTKRVRRQPMLERLEPRQLLTNGLSEFAVTTAASQPMSVTTGPDGNLWFTEYTSGKIGKMSPSGTVLAEYSLKERRGRCRALIILTASPPARTATSGSPTRSS